MPTCPKCTGHYGGRVPVKDDNGNIVLTNRWRCHCDVNGGDLSIWERDANGDVAMKPKDRWPAKPCGLLTTGRGTTRKDEGDETRFARQG